MENDLHEKMLEFFTGLKRHERKVKQRAIKLPMKVCSFLYIFFGDHII